MNTTTPHENTAPGARRRQLRMMQLIFAGAATVALLALFHSAGSTETTLGSGSVRLADTAFPLTPPGLSGTGGFATDSDDDQAQLQQQIDQQMLQQSMQQAQEQNDEAEQQFNQDMQQQQLYENQFNNP
jgi:hypothetical protein